MTILAAPASGGGACCKHLTDASLWHWIRVWGMGRLERRVMPLLSCFLGSWLGPGVGFSLGALGEGGLRYLRPSGLHAVSWTELAWN